ncbi:unnamed protein product [Rotaria magnacalcarata]|uniref:Uncharacterized protein n=2 Tax=Rotaria magnacalcarata TaxID=392030 RepID=A0A816SZ55_9BILA|nr:unnamed protein product [Rotaria magnacalcarata]
MLITLKVPRVPASWYKLTEIVKRTEDTSKSNQQIIDSTCYFCPECEQESTNPSKCTNAKCSYYFNCLVTPHTFMVMNIQQQIEEVLRSTHQNDLDLSPQTSTESTTSLIDIHNRDVYKNIVHSLRNENHKFFISLTCNIDGTAVYTSNEQSMWTFIACLNELKRSIRFNIEKMIGTNFAIRRKKPSRLIMQQMLNPIVTRLKLLQKPCLYRLPNGFYQMLRVYLIGISNDKPANSIVQNQPEPNALFGCAKCEIAGRMTPAKLHATPNQSGKITTVFIRIFPTEIGEQPEMRSNARWFEISHAVQNDEMNLLLTSFVDEFPYHERYVVQTVHCVKHFATTTKDFGPLSNYSTFNYESVVGCLSSSVHGTKNVSSELAKNIDLFKKAYHASIYHSSYSELSPFIEYLKSGRKYSSKPRLSNKTISQRDLDILYQLISKETRLKSMKSITRYGLILSTMTSSKSKKFTDACVVYQYQNIVKYGIIEDIFYGEQQDLYLLKIRSLQDTYYDTITFKSKTFVNEHIIYGNISHDVFDFIDARNVIEKCSFYENDKVCYFARFPNLYESS